MCWAIVSIYLFMSFWWNFCAHIKHQHVNICSVKIQNSIKTKPNFEFLPFRRQNIYHFTPFGFSIHQYRKHIHVKIFRSLLWEAASNITFYFIFYFLSFVMSFFRWWNGKCAYANALSTCIPRYMIQMNVLVCRRPIICYSMT